MRFIHSYATNRAAATGGMGFQPMNHGQDARATSHGRKHFCSLSCVLPREVSYLRPSIDLNAYTIFIDTMLVPSSLDRRGGGPTFGFVRNLLTILKVRDPGRLQGAVGRRFILTKPRQGRRNL